MVIGPVVWRRSAGQEAQEGFGSNGWAVDVGLVKQKVCPKVGLRSSASGLVFLGWLSVLQCESKG